MFRNTERNCPDRLPMEIDLSGTKCDKDSLTMRAPITNRHQHPVEASEREYQRKMEQKEFSNAAKTFGSGFALHLTHERAAVRAANTGHPTSSVYHSDAAYDSLTGRDLTFDFTDSLALDLQTDLSPHEIMERRVLRNKL